MSTLDAKLELLTYWVIGGSRGGGNRRSWRLLLWWCCFSAIVLHTGFPCFDAHDGVNDGYVLTSFGLLTSILGSCINEMICAVNV